MYSEFEDVNKNGVIQEQYRELNIGLYIVILENNKIRGNLIDNFRGKGARRNN